MTKPILLLEKSGLDSLFYVKEGMKGEKGNRKEFLIVVVLNLLFITRTKRLLVLFDIIRQNLK